MIQFNFTKKGQLRPCDEARLDQNVCEITVNTELNELKLSAVYPALDKILSAKVLILIQIIVQIGSLFTQYESIRLVFNRKISDLIGCVS